MKKRIVTAAIISLYTAKSFTQTNSQANMQANVNNLYTEVWSAQTTNLNLTPIQVSQWQALDAADLQQADAIISNTALTNDQKQAQLTTLAAQQQTQLKKILSTLQYAKWSAQKNAVKQVAANGADSAQSKASSRPVRTGRRG